MNSWQYLVFAYLALAFVKFMLCAYHLPAAIFAVSRMHGAKRGRAKPLFFFVVPVALALTILIGLPVTLFREGFGFFSFYSRFTILRACAEAHRSAAHKPS